MNAQTSLLSLAIAAALAAAAPASAATPSRSADARAAVVARADALLSGNQVAARAAAGDRFIARDAIADANGSEHVRYQRTWNGMPVIGGDVVVHSRNGRLDRVTRALASSARPSLRTGIDRDSAIVEAGARFNGRFVGVPAARLVVYARDTAPVLAYEVVFNGIKADQTPTEMHYFVAAGDGRVLDGWDTVQTARPGGGGGAGGGCTPVAATGAGHSMALGSVMLDTAKCGTSYQLVDLTRGGGATHTMAMLTAGMGSVVSGSTNVWGSGAINNAQTVAADAHYGIAMTWDYFKNAHGRLGIANDGQGAISRVHYGRNYGNAFWSDGCFCMTFGDGDNGATILPMVGLDVAGHEMSHGVTSRSAGLVYSGESGGLNEATSDIFGTMVEYYANNPANPPNYVLGEKLFPNNASMRQAIRWMFKPSLDGASADCYSSSVGSMDVHYSSGVANHFFYLLAEGATVPAGFGMDSWAKLTPAKMVCNGNTALAGIGRDAAGKIWYRALTVYMTSTTNYAAARAATLNAANDLYGPGSAQSNAVAAAWSAVSVN